MIKGSRYAVRTNRNRPGYRAVVKTVGIKGVDQLIDTNVGLWSITDRVDSLKCNCKPLTVESLLN